MIATANVTLDDRFDWKLLCKKNFCQMCLPHTFTIVRQLVTLGRHQGAFRYPEISFIALQYLSLFINSKKQRF